MHTQNIFYIYMYSFLKGLKVFRVTEIHLHVTSTAPQSPVTLTVF